MNIKLNEINIVRNLVFILIWFKFEFCFFFFNLESGYKIKIKYLDEWNIMTDSKKVWYEGILVLAMDKGVHCQQYLSSRTETHMSIPLYFFDSWKYMYISIETYAIQEIF